MCGPSSVASTWRSVGVRPAGRLQGRHPLQTSNARCLRRSLLVMGRIPLQKRHLRHIPGQQNHSGRKSLPRKGLAPHTNSERRKHPSLETVSQLDRYRLVTRRMTVTEHIDASSRPVVVGTDMKVSQLAFEYEHHRMTPDEIVDAHPHLSLAAVHAALAYYYDHQEGIRQEWMKDCQLVESLRARYHRAAASA